VTGTGHLGKDDDSGDVLGDDIVQLPRFAGSRGSSITCVSIIRTMW
jgi:hypothetical protein